MPMLELHDDFYFFRRGSFLIKKAESIVLDVKTPAPPADITSQFWLQGCDQYDKPTRIILFSGKNDNLNFPGFGQKSQNYTDLCTA